MTDMREGQREAAVHVLFKEAPSWWGENDIGIIADEVMEAADFSIEHELWTQGMGLAHAGCPNAEDWSDALYENPCHECAEYLRGVAERIRQAWTEIPDRTIGASDDWFDRQASAIIADRHGVDPTTPDRTVGASKEER